MWKRMLVVQLMFFFWFREIIFLLISLWLIFLCFFSDICNTETICMNVHVTSEENRNFSKNFARNFKKVFSLKIKIKVKKQLFFAFFWIFWTFNFKKKSVKKKKNVRAKLFPKIPYFHLKWHAWPLLYMWYCIYHRKNAEIWIRKKSTTSSKDNFTETK